MIIPSAIYFLQWKEHIEVIFVCKQHVYKALKVIFLPHIQAISDDNKLHKEVKCQVCGKQADYKLYNFIPQRKRAI
jgi:hypothetical protein